MRLISAYAPHNGHPYELRQAFFADLSESITKGQVHGPTLVLGDLNSRLHYRCPDEEAVMGPHAFGNAHAV